MVVLKVERLVVSLAGKKVGCSAFLVAAKKEILKVEKLVM